MFLNIPGKSGNGRQRCCAQVHCCGSVASEGPVHEILVISKNQTPHDTWNWMLSMKWKERLAEHYLIVLFSVVQTFISKPFTCPFLQSLWQEEGMGLSKSGWPWRGESSKKSLSQYKYSGKQWKVASKLKPSCASLDLNLKIIRKQITNTCLKPPCGTRTMGLFNCTDCWKQSFRKAYFGTINKVQLFHFYCGTQQNYQ